MTRVGLDLPDEVVALIADQVAARVAPPAPAGPVAYTVATLAAELRLSEKAVRGAIARGELAAARRGGRWLISDTAVRAWATPDDPSAPRRSTARRSPSAGGGPLGSALADIAGEARA